MKQNKIGAAAVQLEKVSKGGDKDIEVVKNLVSIYRKQKKKSSLQEALKKISTQQEVNS